jgi:hypothetical protein
VIQFLEIVTIRHFERLEEFLVPVDAAFNHECLA